MALYTLKTKEEALAPLSKYAGGSKWVEDQLKSIGYNNFGVSITDSANTAKSRSQLAKDNFNALSNNGGEFFSGYVDAAQKAKDNNGYKNLFNESAFGTANSSFTKALDKIGYDNINNADEWLAKYNSLSSDDKWDVYQNLQNAKNKLTQAYTKADNENNEALKDAYGSGLRYVGIFDDMISDIDKGDKSFGKSVGDWLTSGGIAGDMSKPMVNALGDITGSAETAKYVNNQYDTQNEGNHGIVNAVNTAGTTIGNIGANVVTGGGYGLGTSAVNLAHEGISAVNDADRTYYVDQSGNIVRQNQTDAQKAADIGGAAFNLGLNVLGKAGVGPTLKFGNNASLQELAKSGNLRELAKGVGKYALKETPWALATSTADTAIQAAGYGDEAWKNYGKNLGNNILNDVAIDVTGAVRQGVRQNSATNENVASKMPEAQETEVYRAVTGDNGETNGARDITNVFEPDANLNIQKRNKLQSLGERLQNAGESQKYMDLYNSLDKSTAQNVANNKTPQLLASLGVKPQNYKAYAETSTYVNKVMSDLADKSGVRVNAPDLPTKLSYDSAENADVTLSSDALKKYNNNIRRVVETGEDMNYSAGDLLRQSREFGRLAENVSGNADDKAALRKLYNRDKWILRDLATGAMDEAGLFGDLTDDNIATGLKQIGANQKVQDYYTAAIDGKSPTAADYIRRTAPFEAAREMATEMESEPLTRSASKTPTNPLTMMYRSSGLEQPVNTVLSSVVSPIAGKLTKGAGKIIGGAGDVAAKVGSVTKGLSPENISNTAKKAVDNAKAAGSDFTKNLTNFEASGTNPQMFMYSAVNNNDVKENAMEKERVANYLTAVANDTNTAGPMTSETAVYNTVVGNTGATNGVANGSTATQNSIFPRTGDYWTDLIAGAMELAMEADDAAAFNNLYSMYQDAVSKQTTQKDMSNPANWSSSDRKEYLKAQNGLDQIDALEQSYYNAVGEGGGNVVQGNLRGFANAISGGNLDPSAENYVKQANSIGAGIIKNLVNLGSTEYDAERYIDYLPKLTDTKEQAAQKLQTLRKAYEDIIKNLQSINYA